MVNKSREDFKHAIEIILLTHPGLFDPSQSAELLSTKAAELAIQALEAEGLEFQRRPTWPGYKISSSGAY